MTDDIEVLRETLRVRHLIPAKDKRGAPILTSVRNNPNLSYICLEDYMKIIKRRKLNINPLTLQLKKVGAAKPIPPRKPKTVGKPPAKPKPKIASTDKAKETWTRAELEKLSYDDLRNLAKLWDDVHGNKGTTHMLDTLTGKPKSLLPS